MSDRDPRRLVCDELAELLATPEGLRTARLLQMTEALEPRGSSAGSASSSRPQAADWSEAEGTAPSAISIWRPRRRDGELIFERPEPHPLGDHHACRRTFTAAKPKGATRICFFGESVAAGYLYAPHWTPAEVLERQLGANAGKYEVVDLARTNETLDSMVGTIEQAQQLAPDLLVIFAGNNWNLLETPELSPYVPSVAVRQRVALALRRDGLAGLAAYGRRLLAARVNRAFERIAQLAQRHQTAVIVVVPEVNLGDWHDRQPVAWLPGDRNRRWHESYSEALGHLRAGRGEALLKAAGRLLELDGGLCPTSHRLRAEALRLLGEVNQAREACEAEVENGCYAYQCFLGVPRMGPSAAALLRRQASLRGLAIVDLPAIFAEAPGLPDRRHFLDYCHLSARGIERAMMAVAEKILAATGNESTKSVARSEAAPEPRVEALARFGAAIHGAHRLLAVGDKRLTLERWCREALAAEPKIAETMRDLLAARCATPCPAVLNAAQQRALGSPQQLLLQHGWRWNDLDVDLLEAICAALEDAGHPVRDEVATALQEAHAVDAKGVDLSRSPYLWEPLERFYPEAMAARGLTGRATYRSPWPESSFCLIADGARDLQLELTVRLPAIAGAAEPRQEKVTVALDGEPVASLKIEESWSCHRIQLPRQALQRTIHRVTLSWPRLPACGTEALDRAIRRLESGVEADLHPVFGEVFSLIARAADAGRDRV